MGDNRIGTRQTYSIRQPVGYDLDRLGALVRDNWDEACYRRFYDQFVEYLNGGPYDPEFYVAVIKTEIIGFVALRQSMIMDGFWELPWVVVRKDYQGGGIGDGLMNFALDVVRGRDGLAVLLATQKPTFFKRLGFLTDREHGNGWHAMSAQLKLAGTK